MTSLNAQLEYGLLRPIRERLPMTQNVPNHWLVLLTGGGATGFFSLFANIDFAVASAGIIGLATAMGTAISFLIVKVGQARIQVDRERLGLEKERAVALDGTFAGKLQAVSEKLDLAEQDRHAQKELIATLQATTNEMKKRVEDANRKLHDAADVANETSLRHAEEMELLSKQHAAELAGLRGELAKVNAQLATANAQIEAMRGERDALKRVVDAAVKKTVQNTAEIAATAAKVERMQQDSGSIPTVPGNAASEPTVDMPTVPDPTQPGKSV